MTTVAAVAADGAVHMAADSCTTVYDRPIIDGARKIRRIRVGSTEALLAMCGAGALADLLAAELDLNPPAVDAGDLQFWAMQVARAATAIAVDAGIVEDGHLDGLLLLGYRGQLWTITHSHAIPHPDGIAALGSGEGPAIGALDAKLAAGCDPAAAVLEAVRIACHRDRYSAEPVYFESLGS